MQFLLYFALHTDHFDCLLTGLSESCCMFPNDLEKIKKISALCYKKRPVTMSGEAVTKATRLPVKGCEIWACPDSEKPNNTTLVLNSSTNGQSLLANKELIHQIHVWRWNKIKATEETASCFGIYRK